MVFRLGQNTLIRNWKRKKKTKKEKIMTKTLRAKDFVILFFGFAYLLIEGLGVK